jgi:hypothetical protein
MARTRQIDTNPADVSCDVCGRTLLRGERAEAFLAGGSRRTVCELCTARAQHEGWILESGIDEVAVRTPQRERGRSFLDRLRSRRDRARELAAVDSDDDPEFELPPLDNQPYEAPAPAPPPPPAPRKPRHVRAVPTNAELKMQRALEVFNSSQHVRTVGGVARSLGAPAVFVRPLVERPSVVSIAVMWELSWYRFEVDLSDEGSGVLRAGHGAELSELSPEDQYSNAAADERGALSLSAPAEDA